MTQPSPSPPARDRSSLRRRCRPAAPWSGGDSSGRERRRAFRRRDPSAHTCSGCHRGRYHDRGQERKKPATQFLSVLIAGYDGVGTRGGPQARALSRAPDGLRGLTAAPRSNRCSPCDRRQTVACCAKSLTQGNRRVELLAALSTPKQITSSLRIAATTICFPLS